MKFIQSLILRLFPDAEVESRRWTFTCGQCQAISDVWEAGGVRYKAFGKPTVLLRCPKCQQRTFSTLSKDEYL